MKVTIELSLYPLKENYTQVIIDFIKNLKSYESILVRTNAMSTYLSGDYDKVFEVLSKELKKVHLQIPDSCTAMKIIPKDLNVENGFLEF